MRSAILLTTLALASCGSQGGNTVSAAPSPTASPTASPAPVAGATSDSTAEAAAIRAVIDKGYGGYNAAENGGSAFDNSPDFQAAWTHAVGKDGSLDFDPYCQCQDFGKVRWKIDKVDVTGDTARADIRVDLFGNDEWKKTWIAFRRVGGKWLVDDLDDGEGKGLKAAMRAAAPGSMGIDG